MNPKNKSCFVIVDLERADQPVIYANKAFYDLTKFPKEEVVGKNCRFLQGELTSQKAIESISEAVKNKQAVRQDIINYKKTGEPFWNRLVLLPFSEDSHEFFLGVQMDISQKKPPISTTAADHSKADSLAKDEVFFEIENPLHIISLGYASSSSDASTRKLVTQSVDEAVENLAIYIENLD